MKKGIVVLKAFAFLLIFCVLFLSVQEVLRYKSTDESKLRAVYRSYMAETGGVDVVFMGSSGTYVGIAPPVMWKERGITAYNLGIAFDCSLIDYYQLRFLLEARAEKPKLVVLDFYNIYKDQKADDDKEFEFVHKNVARTYPIWDLRNEMILQIKKDNPKQDILTYYFPLLQVHSRWNEVTVSDFIPSEFKEYRKGAEFPVRFSEEIVECSADMFEADIGPMPISEYSWGYYKQIIDLCVENDIGVAVVTMPRGTSTDLIRLCRTIEQVCDENNIRYYDLSTPENWDALAIDGANDFYNTGHVNANGAMKVSKALAEILQEDFGLPDHRGDPAYSAWDDTWDEFYAAYENVLAPFGY